MSHQIFDVYHAEGFPHRILQGVTLQQLQDWCAARGYTHQAHRDSQQGCYLTDAFVAPAN